MITARLQYAVQPMHGSSSRDSVAVTVVTSGVQASSEGQVEPRATLVVRWIVYALKFSSQQLHRLQRFAYGS